MTAVSAATDLTVCVVVKDRKDLMRACLDALLSQTVAPAGLVVVDNGSSDGTYEMLLDAADRAPLSMLVIQDAGSLGHIRNLAVRHAATRLVAFTDSDCVPHPDWVERTAKAWGGSDDDRLACIQGRTIPQADAARTSWDATQDLQEFTRLFEACNISYLRDALLATPGFDEEVGFFGEDTAAGWHVLRTGKTATFAADAVVEHVVTPVGLRWHLRRAGRYGNFCALVRLFPEMRDDLLWHRWFLRRRNAMAWLALLGALAAGVGVLGLASTHGAVSLLAWAVLAVAGIVSMLPWLRMVTPRGVSPKQGVAAVAGVAAFDLLVILSLAIGSVRHRTLVL